MFTHNTYVPFVSLQDERNIFCVVNDVYTVRDHPATTMTTS